MAWKGREKCGLCRGDPYDRYAYGPDPYERDPYYSRPSRDPYEARDYPPERQDFITKLEDWMWSLIEARFERLSIFPGLLRKDHRTGNLMSS